MTFAYTPHGSLYWAIVPLTVWKRRERSTGKTGEKLDIERLGSRVWVVKNEEDEHLIVFRPRQGLVCECYPKKRSQKCKYRKELLLSLRDNLFKSKVS